MNSVAFVLGLISSILCFFVLLFFPALQAPRFATIFEKLGFLITKPSSLMHHSLTLPCVSVFVYPSFHLIIYQFFHPYRQSNSAKHISCLDKASWNRTKVNVQHLTMKRLRAHHSERIIQWHTHGLCTNFLLSRMPTTSHLYYSLRYICR